MSVRSAQAVTFTFTTKSPTTGAQTAPDALPTGVLRLNAVDNAATVTVSLQATGKYSAAVTLPTLAIGDLVEVVITAVVAAVTDSDVLFRDICDV